MQSIRELPRIAEIQQLARTSLFEIEAINVRFPNGAERRLERLKNRTGSTVLMVPLLDAKSVLLVWEYCVGTNTYELMFPTGTVGTHERMEDAVQRELREEIGYGALSISHLASLKSFPGHLDHDTHVFIASDLYVEKLPGDEPQPLQIVKCPISNLADLFDMKEFREVRSVAALLLLERFLSRQSATIG